MSSITIKMKDGTVRDFPLSMRAIARPGGAQTGRMGIQRERGTA
jgi:hypothetical protein